MVNKKAMTETDSRVAARIVEKVDQLQACLEYLMALPPTTDLAVAVQRRLRGTRMIPQVQHLQSEIQEQLGSSQAQQLREAQASSDSPLLPAASSASSSTGPSSPYAASAAAGSASGTATTEKSRPSRADNQSVRTAPGPRPPVRSAGSGRSASGSSARTSSCTGKSTPART